MTPPRGRSVIGAALVVSLSVGGGSLPAAVAAVPAVTVKVGRAETFSHLEFVGAQPVSVRRDGSDLVLRFPAVAAPDLAELRADPPPFLKTASAVAAAGGGVELRLTLAEGADVRVGRADGTTYVNLFSAAPAANAPDSTPAPRADPVPQSGAVKLQAELQEGRLLLHFPWRAPLGAAAFRRGDAVWVVFDAKARLDLSEAPKDLAEMGKLEVVPAEHALAIRIAVRPETLASLSADGSTWTLALGESVDAKPAPVKLKPVDASLAAQLPGATGVFWLNDPAVGDRLAVVTALGPAKGAAPSTYVDAAVLPSVQGLAIEPLASDLTVVSDGDVVRIGRPSGLSLSPPSTVAREVASPVMGLPQAAALPGLIDFNGWSQTGPAGFLARYDQLLAAAAEESAKGAAGGVQARLGLARFLVGSELAFEAIGQLDLLAKTTPAMLQDPEFRGLRGAARAIAGRYKDAEADFSFPALAADPASALWRGYIDAKLDNGAAARQSFASGRAALGLFAPKWRSRFARTDAEAALAAGDPGAARNDLLIAAAAPLPPVETDALHLDQARLLEAEGHADQARPLLEDASRSAYGGVAAPALLQATEIDLQSGKLAPEDAIKVLDSLRFRWRGDATELETVRALGRIYLAQGRYRDALEALRAAGRNLPDLPEAAAVQADLASAFKTLFLGGGADGLPPVQALGLFFDFKDLTPIGADGDEMVRKLARRLVDVDLLDQAAELLKYQADNRLDGVPRAEVDTDLALIQLMNHQPEQALDAIDASRSTLLPKELAARRRILQARALAALGRYDAADELLENDGSPDALDTRAEVAWGRRDWKTAAALLDEELGDRWRSAEPLGGLDAGRLLRAGIAYSLAGDESGLARLRERYGKLAATSPQPDSLRVALAGLEPGAYSASDYAKATSDADAFAGWVAAMKTRLMNAPLGGGTAKS